MQDGGGLGHLHHEGAAAPRQVVGGADAGKKTVDDADARPRRGHRQPGLCQQHDQGVLPQIGGLAGHVRPGQQQNAPVRGKVGIVRHEGALAGERRLDHRVAPGLDGEPRILRHFRQLEMILHL